MQTGIYIIKPEAMQYREKIRELLKGAGLRIVEFKTAILPESALDQIYPNLDADLRKATTKYMRCGVSEVGVVTGESALSILEQVGGNHTDPNHCEPGTIREMYGNKKGVKFGQAVYFKNAFHRSHNASEALRDINLYNQL